MEHQLPDLPFPQDALTPLISAETLEYHHGKHHKTYVDKLNGLIKGTEYAEMSLEEIIKKASGGIFNNAAQIFNHTFYWKCMTTKSKGGGEPSGKVADLIKDTFGSFAEFKEKFSTSAATNFGSGWTWLVKNANNSIEILNTSNAGTPLTTNQTPLLTIDVWEHAYYIDYRNARPKYIEAWFDLVNWDFVNQNL